jgi:peptidoglycan hydrolase-like protein with peptidoglycan-binding domain
VQTPPVLRTLRLGDSAQAVRALQQRLNELGYACGRADGVFGARTKAAVMAYQSKAGLFVDGVAGPQTLTRLYQAQNSVQAPEVSQPPAAPQAPIVIQPPVSNNPSSSQPALGLAKVVTQNGGSLNMRSQKVQRASTFMRTIPNLSMVSLLSRENDWCLVSYDGSTGYVMSKFLQFETVEPGEPPAPEQTLPPIQTTLPVQTPAPDDSGVLEEEEAQRRTLRGGEAGEDVYSLQQRLKELLYPVQETSVYDEQTKEAVRSFQGLNGLTADGICGNNTYAVLESAAAVKYGQVPTSFQTLRIDNKGTGVSQLQTRLKELGFSLNVSGTYDIATHQAVVAFQDINGLVVSGIADSATQRVLYGAGAKDTSNPVSGVPEGTGASPGNVQLLHWDKDVKPSISAGQRATVYHPGSGKSFTIRFYSLGRHADSEPLTYDDTKVMNSAFGTPSWNINTVYVQLPSGAWTLATMHNRPHLTGAINNNGFGGHLCVHFLRDMAEAQKNDPNYGVSNQKAIRSAWERMTGEKIED